MQQFHFRSVLSAQKFNLYGVCTVSSVHSCLKHVQLCTSTYYMYLHAYSAHYSTHRKETENVDFFVNTELVF